MVLKLSLPEVRLLISSSISIGDVGLMKKLVHCG